jgi:hypothetical protein
MFGRIENFYKKLPCEIEKYLAVCEHALGEIIATERDQVTLLFERHNTEVLQRIHRSDILKGKRPKKCHVVKTVKFGSKGHFQRLWRSLVSQ